MQKRDALGFLHHQMVVMFQKDEWNEEDYRVAGKALTRVAYTHSPHHQYLTRTLYDGMFDYEPVSREPGYAALYLMVAWYQILQFDSLYVKESLEVRQMIQQLLARIKLYHMMAPRTWGEWLVQQCEAWAHRFVGMEWDDRWIHLPQWGLRASNEIWSPVTQYRDSRLFFL